MQPPSLCSGSFLVGLTECSPRASCFCLQKLEGLESKLFKELKTSPDLAPEHSSKRTRIHNLGISSGSLLLSDVESAAFRCRVCCFSEVESAVVRCSCMVVVECKCLLFMGCTMLVYSPEYACC